MTFGKVIQVIGPIVDIKFPEETQVPQLLNAVRIEDKERNINLVLEVAQIIGNNTVRCVALAPTDGLVRGMKVIDLEAPISVPVGEQTLGQDF